MHALVDFLDLIELAQIQPGVDPVHVEVHRHRDDVEIARALAVAEQSPFHAVGPGQQAQLRRGHSCAAVVMRVQADNQRFAIPDVPADPLDLVGINIRHGDFHRVRQVQDHLVLRRRLPDVHDRFADFPGELDLGGAEALRRVLEHDFGALEPRQALLDHLRAADRHLDDLLLRHAEDHAPLGRRGGVVQVNDRLFGADERLEGALDQVLPGLHQHLEPDVLRRAVFLDQPPVEGELGVGGGGEAHFDFLEAALHQGLKKLQLLADVHGHGQGLVAVAQIHAAPFRRAG